MTNRRKGQAVMLIGIGALLAALTATTGAVMAGRSILVLIGQFAVIAISVYCIWIGNALRKAPERQR